MAFHVQTPSVLSLPQLTTANLSDGEKYRIHSLLRKLQPNPADDHLDEPYPLIMFLFRHLGLFLRTMAPHLQSFFFSLVEFERQYNVARGMLDMGIVMAERGVNIAIKLGVNDALMNFGTALGRGVGESYKAYKGQ